MKIANICPPDLLDDVIDEGETYHLVLTSIINKYPAYREFYLERIERGDFVILDNDAYEITDGGSTDDLIRAIQELKPSEVVLPDKRFIDAATALGFRTILFTDATTLRRELGRLELLPEQT